MGETIHRPGRLTQLIAHLLAALLFSQQVLVAAPTPSSLPASQISKVLIIQDIHLHTEAQRSIAATLQDLINRKEVGLVGVEGAFRSFDFTPLRQSGDAKHRQALADGFLRDKYISAPSYVGVTSQASLPPFLGVDHRGLYEANVEAYRESKPQQRSIARSLAQAEKNMKVLKVRVFNKSLLSFETLSHEYDNGRLSLGEFLERLPFVVQSPEAVKFLKAYRLEQYVDFKEAEKERAALLNQLAGKMNKEELTRFTQLTLEYKSGSITFVAYGHALKAVLQKAGLSMDSFPAFRGYFNYALLSDQVDADVLLKDVRSIQNEALRRLTKTQEEKELLQASRLLVLQKKLVDFSLMPEEWAEYVIANAPRNDSDYWRGMKQSQIATAFGLAMTIFEAFYELADLRSRFMADQMISGLKTHRADKAVLIAGGFHTSHLKDYLEQAGVSVRVIRPRFTQIEGESGSAYLSAFDQQKSPLEKILEGKALTVYPVQVHLTQGEGPDAAFSAGMLPSASLVRVSPTETFSTTPGIRWGWLRIGPALSGAGYYFQRVASIPDIIFSFANRHPYAVGWALMMTFLIDHWIRQVPLTADKLAASGIWWAWRGTQLKTSEVIDEKEEKWRNEIKILTGSTIVEISGQMPVPSPLYEALRLKLKASKNETHRKYFEEILWSLSEMAMPPELLGHIFEQSRHGPGRMVVISPLQDFIDLRLEGKRTNRVGLSVFFHDILKPLQKDFGVMTGEGEKHYERDVRVPVVLPNGEKIELRIWVYSSSDEKIDFYYFDMPYGKKLFQEEWSRRWILGRGALALLKMGITDKTDILVLNNQDSVFAVPSLVNDTLANDPAFSDLTIVHRSHKEKPSRKLSISQLNQFHVDSRYHTLGENLDYPSFSRDDEEGNTVAAYENRGTDLSRNQDSYQVDITRLLLLLSHGTYTLDANSHDEFVSRPVLADLAYRVFPVGPDNGQHGSRFYQFRRWGIPFNGVKGSLSFYTNLLYTNLMMRDAYQKGKEVAQAVLATDRDPQANERLDSFWDTEIPFMWKIRPGMGKPRHLFFSPDIRFKYLADILDFIQTLGLVSHWTLLFHLSRNQDSLVYKLQKILDAMKSGGNGQEAELLKRLAADVEGLLNTIRENEDVLARHQHRFDGMHAKFVRDYGHRKAPRELVEMLGAYMATIQASEYTVLANIAKLHGFLKRLKSGSILSALALPALIGVVNPGDITLLIGLGLVVAGLVYFGKTLMKPSPKSVPQDGSLGVAGFGRKAGTVHQERGPAIHPERAPNTNRPRSVLRLLRAA